jgi:prepilin-type N-terminal cleavage/methylation domain-containing protein
VQLIRERLAGARRDDGFTLIEMVITVAILGIISVALCGVMFQYFTSTTATSARLNESTDEQFVSTYWQNDVSSLGRRSFATSTNTFVVDQSVFVGAASSGDCGYGIGSRVVGFGWNEFETDPTAPDPWSTKAQGVAYVTVPNAGGGLTLQRVRCKGAAVGTPLTVAHNLTGTPAISCDTTCTAATPPNRVSMTFSVKDAKTPGSPGYTTTVSADRRQG